MSTIKPISHDRKTEAREKLNNFCKDAQLFGGLALTLGLSGPKSCNFNCFAPKRTEGVKRKGRMSVKWEGNPEWEENDDGRLERRRNAFGTRQASPLLGSCGPTTFPCCCMAFMSRNRCSGRANSQAWVPWVF